MNWLPSYIQHEFGVAVQDLASFTVLPYVLQGGVGLFAGIIADRWIAGGMPVRRCRQLMQGIGMVTVRTVETRESFSVCQTKRGEGVEGEEEKGSERGRENVYGRRGERK